MGYIFILTNPSFPQYENNRRCFVAMACTIWILPKRRTVRFLLVPSTIFRITWLRVSFLIEPVPNGSVLPVA